MRQFHVAGLALSLGLLVAVAQTLAETAPLPTQPPAGPQSTVQTGENPGFCGCADISGEGKCTVVHGQCAAGYVPTCDGKPDRCSCSCVKPEK